MRRAPTFLLLTVACVALTACDASKPVAPLAAREFDIAEGQTAVVADGRLRVTFVQVAEDNRCPPEAQCIVAGSATVALGLESDGVQGTLALTTVMPGSSGIFHGFRLTLLQLNPVGPVQTPAYRARFEVVSALD
jgi:hypothetical protein